MIRIQRVYGSVLPIEKMRIEQTQGIFRRNFSAVADYADKIPDMLDNPFKYGYVSTLLVSEAAIGNMKGGPTGSFVLAGASLRQVGRRIAKLGLPTLVAQEGGYSIRNLRRGAPAFFNGFAETVAAQFNGKKT